MNRLFLKIFIWFSAAGLLTFGISLGVWQLTLPGADDPFTTFGLAPQSARFADGQIVEVDRLHAMREPLKWVAEHGFNLAVYLRNGSPLLESTENLPPEMRALALASMERETALAQEGPSGSLLFASLISSDLAIVSQIPPRRPDASLQILLLRWAVPLLTGLLLCLALARYISSPVEKLRQATAQLAAGNLKARLGDTLGNRRDELADAGHAFDQMADQIQELVESERRLLGDISHELRSPLARLAVAVELERGAAETARPMLDRIDRERERIDELIGELLRLTRLREGARLEDEQPVDMAALAREVALDAEFESQIDKRHVDVRAEGSIWARGEASLLRSALENLVRNALHYTAPDSAVRIRVLQRGDRIEVVVRDHGSGVPADALPRLFAPFYRVDESRTRQTGGTGLGLAIVQHIVARHGGHIHAENAETGGLEVKIDLPAAPEDG
jgi:signal transduction histidine kinase